MANTGNTNPPVPAFSGTAVSPFRLGTIATPGLGDFLDGRQSQNGARVPRYQSEWEPYGDVDELRVAYKHCITSYVRSAHAKALREALTPMIGRIDRIVTVGMGLPSSGKKTIFVQLAMVNFAQIVLRGENGEHNVELFNSDSMKPMDTAFLTRLLDIKQITYDYNAARKDKRPDTVRLNVSGRDITERMGDHKSDIAGVLDKVTDKTLLFMPCLNIPVRLRILAKTSPAMVITNSLQAMWDRIILFRPNQLCLDDTGKQYFEKDFEDQYLAWVDLKDNYQRVKLPQQFGLVRTEFWAFSSRRAGWPSTRAGWTYGDADLKLNIEVAKIKLIADDEEWSAERYYRELAKAEAEFER